jgi:hypothetical protein
VSGTELRKRRVTKSEHVRFLAHVALDANDLGSVSAQALDRFGEWTLLDIAEYQIHTRRRELSCGRETNTARPARDDRSLSF